MFKFTISLLFLSSALFSQAENQVICFTAQSQDMEFDPMGQFYAISPSGNFAVVTDDEMNDGYLWCIDDPTKLLSLNWYVDGRKVPLEVRGINDEGTVVGSYRPFGSNSWVPFIKELSGEVQVLPVPTWTLNLNFPCGISNDGNIIGGYLGKSSNPNGKGIGQSHPVVWHKTANGDYEISYSESLRLPHQGFPVNCMITDGTLEGTYLGGSLYCGAASTIAAVYHNGELIKWNELTSEQVPWWYKGTIRGYENASFIDGKRDLYFSSDDVVDSGIYCADYNGNFYGVRMLVGQRVTENVEDENYGKTQGDKYIWGKYNVVQAEWETAEGKVPVSCAINENMIFSNLKLYDNGIGNEAKPLMSTLGVSGEGKNIMGVARASADGRVLGLTYSSYDAMGVEHAYPMLLLLDEPLVGEANVEIDTDNQVMVRTQNGVIEVLGAKDVSIYDMTGRMVSKSATSLLPAGIYVVRADTSSYKVYVR